MDRLNEDDRVELSLPWNGPVAQRVPLDCYVLAVAGRTVALEAVDREAALRLPETTENVLLAFRQGTSLVALKGVVVTDPIPGDLRFVAPPHEGLRRKRATRADIRIPIIVRRTGSVTCVSAYSVNLSVTGMLAECTTPLSAGDEVEIGLLPTAEHEAVLPAGVVTVTGAVLRAAQGLVAVGFDRASVTRHRAFLSRTVIEGRREARLQMSALSLAGHQLEI